MRTTIFSILLLSTLFLVSSSTQSTLPTVVNNAFAPGEYLKYRVSYGAIDAGEVVMMVKSTSLKAGNRDLIHVEGTGKTLGSFNSFYRVNDKYESYMDKKGLFPWFFYRRVHEGGYKLNQDYVFYQDKKLVSTGKKTLSIPIGIQDMISSFYYARTMNFKGMKIGKVIEFSCFMDDQIWTLKTKYVGDEVIKIKAGSFKCHKFVPVVQTGRVFKSEKDLNFWVTADENKIPILVKAKIPVGYVKLHLVDYKGIKNNLTSKQK
jgi:hypothetical protein